MPRSGTKLDSIAAENLILILTDYSTAGLVFNQRTGICTWPDEAHKTGCSSEGKTWQTILHAKWKILINAISHRIVSVHVPKSRWRHGCNASTVRRSRRLPVFLCMHQWWTTETEWMQTGSSLWRCYQAMRLGTKNPRMVHEITIFTQTQIEIL